MLSYVTKAFLRNPRRAFAAIAGVALAVALFADAAFFIDGSGRRMTRRAVAHVTIDMQAGLNKPLASSMALAASLSSRPPLAPGQAVTITFTVTNTAPRLAHFVLLDAPVPPLLAYVPGSAIRNGVPVPDVPPTEEHPVFAGALDSPLLLADVAPGGTATVTYGAVTRQAVSSAADLLAATIRSFEDPAPAPANGPKAVDIAALAATTRGLPDVRVAQPFALAELPAGAVQVDGRPLAAPVKVVAVDPSYAHDIPIVAFRGGTYQPGTAFLSPAAAQQLGAAPGSTVQLLVPGRATTLALPISAIADLTRADQLFASRVTDAIGDFMGAPYVVGMDIATFQQEVLPALRVDAAAAVPVLKTPPVLEVHAQVTHAALTSDPGQAFVYTTGVRRSIERAAPGDVTVIDNVSTNLDKARVDSTLAKILFIALGLPGMLLAGYLTFYGGGLLAETERRERALLRARGFSHRMLTRGLAVQAAAIAVLGIAGGLALAIVAASALFPAEYTPHGSRFALSLAMAIGFSALITALAMYVPGRRALRRDVTEARQHSMSISRPAWLRARLDLVLLGIAVVVSAIFVITGGQKPNPKAHDESIARSFYILLAPWALWLGGALLAGRLFLGLSSRVGSRTAPTDVRRHLAARTFVRSVARRPRAVSAAIITITLTVAFGVSLGIFVATFRHEQHADARFVIGSDVRVTTSLGEALPPDITTRLRVPGVRALSPVAQVHDFTVGNEPLLYSAVEPASFERVASLSPGFFTDTTPHDAMAALAQDPNALLVDKETAISLNLHRGDTIKASLPSPSLGQPVLGTFRIAGTFIQIPGFPLGLDFVGNLAAYQQATGTTTPSYFLLSTDGSPPTNARVERSLHVVLDGTVPARVDTTSSTSNRDQTSIAGLSLTGLGRVEGLYTLLIAALAIILFVTAMLVQRNTERATMRALGLGRRRLNAIVLGEPVLITVTGTVAGALLGIPMAYLFVQILRRIFVVPPTTLSIPGSQALLLGALLALTITASAVAIALAIHRLRVAELLRAD